MDPEETEESTETPAPEATPEAPTTPWDADIQAAFDDPAQREAVSAFMREKYQPYVTKLEQDSAPNRDATRLYESFVEDAPGTFTAVANEIYGPEAAQKMLDALDESPSEPTDTPEEAADALGVDLDELPLEARQAIEFVQEQRQEAAYKEAISEVKEDLLDDDVELVEDLFHPFVAAADGDFRLAAENYNEWFKRGAEQFGIKVPDPNEVPDPDVTPPPTINPKAGGNVSAPPTQTQGQSLDDALDEFFAENPSAPPTV